MTHRKWSLVKRFLKLTMELEKPRRSQGKEKILQISI